MAHSTFMHAMLTMPKTERKHSRYMQVSRKPLASIHEEPVSTKSTDPVAAAAPRTLDRKRVKAKRRPLATVADPKQPKNPQSQISVDKPEQKKPIATAPAPVLTASTAADDMAFDDVTISPLYMPVTQQDLDDERYATAEKIFNYLRARGFKIHKEKLSLIQEARSFNSLLVFDRAMQIMEACYLTEKEVDEIKAKYIAPLEELEDRTE